MDYIRAFKEVGAGDVGLVGGKGANLGEMSRAGLPVPPGFCLTADAYRYFVESTGVAAHIQDLLMNMDGSNALEVDKTSARIRELITAQPMPDAIAGPIRSAYSRLVEELGSHVPNAPVAVRSSATAEDLPTASFAGQQDTFLNIRGEEALLAAVIQCWASLWTARATAYRIKQGFDHSQVALAVIVQGMVQSEVSGILFTANPVTLSRDEAVVNASWGLGEAIVSGLVTPDTLVVRKRDGTILDRQVAHKDRLIEYAATGGTAEVEVPPERQDIPALTDEQLRELVALSNRIEKHYGAPMDIEWAYAGGHFYILQARAITTLGQPAGTDAKNAAPIPGEYNRTMFVEIFPDPLSPSFLSVIQPLFHSMLDFTFETLGFQPPRGMDAVRVWYNQPYFSRDYIAAALRPLSPAVREQLVGQIVNPFGHLERGLRGELSPSYIGMGLRLLRFMLRFPHLLKGIIARYRAEIREVDALEVDALSEPQLIARIRALVFETASHLLNYDFLMIALIGITYQVLGTLLQRYLGSESEEVRARLISGVTGNVTMEANKRIWDLAQVAKHSPVVSSLLRQYSGAELMTQLKERAEAQEFLGALDRLLGEYGHREVRMDILYPTWGEDPSPVLAFVRGYLDVGEKASPYQQQARLVQERQELEQQVERGLHGWTGRYLVAPLFRWALAHAQADTRERDTMHFELTRLFPPFRRLLLELGRRWTERGLISQPADIFFLTVDEMGQVAESPRPMQERIRERRTEYEASKRHGAPAIIRNGQEIYVGAPAPSETRSGQFRGIAGSPGRVSGVARIIRGPEEFDRLKTGDILVAPLTNPVWTPLFAIAGGLVTEVGGILSHGAIVAREYGIPAVMAVSGATRVLQEGQRLVVDGSRGIVSVEPGEAD